MAFADRRDIYDIIRKNVVGNETRRMSVACLTNKATITHSEYVILVSCHRQTWLRNPASFLRYS